MRLYRKCLEWAQQAREVCLQMSPDECKDLPPQAASVSSSSSPPPLSSGAHEHPELYSFLALRDLSSLLQLCSC